MRVLVAGAGIAGLATAALLGRAGVNVTVVERSAHPTAQGAGLQVSPNAAHVLRAIGALDQVRALSIEPTSIVLRDGQTGRDLTQFRLGSLVERRYEAPYLLLERSALRDILLEAASAVAELRFDTPVAQWNENTARVSVQLPTGFEEFDALVGADGVRSGIRTRLNGGSACLRDTGKVAWRRTAREERTDATVVSLFANEHMVVYPLRSGTNEVWVRERNTPPPQDGWSAWPILSVHPEAVWTSSRVALVGDAAHAMPPYAAQGGAMALEDAAVLAAALVDEAELGGAFSIYEARRRPRIATIRALTESNRRIYHMSGALRLARNAAMALTTQAVVQRRMASVYSWRPPKIRSSPGPSR